MKRQKSSSLCEELFFKPRICSPDPSGLRLVNPCCPDVSGVHDFVPQHNNDYACVTPVSTLEAKPRGLG